uniref:Uncharacterized protein n=1 Tax=Rhizophora mucronata TaxID=61149 RepID=A0A2P2PNH7_RHIMU
MIIKCPETYKIQI